MANYITLSNANPFKFYRQQDIFGILSASVNAANMATYNPSFNTRTIDQDFYYRNITKWMAKIKYFQPVQMSDPILLQWEGIKTLGAGAPFTFNVLSGTGGVVKTVSVTSGSNLSATHRLYEIFTNLSDLEDGIYFFQIKMQGYGSVYDEYLISEPIKLKLKHEGSLLFEYKHTSNEYGVYYESNIVFRKRFTGQIKTLEPDSQFVTYKNDPMDATLLSGSPMRGWVVEVGDNKHGLPNYELDKLDLIMLHDTVYIDGILYTRAEGAQVEKIIVRESELSCAKIKVNQSDSNTDLTVSDVQSIVLYSMPKGKVVFINQLTSSSPALTLTINRYFKSWEHLLAFLNGTYRPVYFNTDPLINFAINSKNQLVVNCYNSTSQTVFANMVASKILDKYIKLKVDTINNGTGDIIIDVVPSTGTKTYARFTNNGVAASVGTYSGSTTFSYTYSTVGKYDYYLFLESFNTLTNNSDPIMVELGGLIHESCTDFVFTDGGVKQITTNLTEQCNGALNTLNISNNSLESRSIEQQIMFLYQNMLSGKIDSGLTANFSLQSPSSSPTKTDSGFSQIMSLLKQGITSLLTD